MPRTGSASHQPSYRGTRVFGIGLTFRRAVLAHFKSLQQLRPGNRPSPRFIVELAGMRRLGEIVGRLGAVALDGGIEPVNYIGLRYIGFEHAPLALDFFRRGVEQRLAALAGEEALAFNFALGVAVVQRKLPGGNDEFARDAGG